MQLNIATMIGALAALASVASFLPQAWKIMKTAEVEGLSLPMYALTATGFALWFAFEWLKKEWPLMVPNGLCFLIALAILGMILFPQRMREKISEKTPD